MYFTKRTDMAVEITAKCGCNEAIHRQKSLFGINYTETIMTKEGQMLTGRAQGRYYTVEIEPVTDINDAVRALTVILRSLFPVGKCLVAGLGNPEIMADSLGWKTAGRILSTSQFIEQGKNSFGIGDVSVMRTNVSANSGIESTTQVKAFVRAINAAFVIAIDSLSCESPHSLCKSIQITDTGIAPGSGAGNPRKRLDKDNIGVPVIAVGVPTSLEYKANKQLFYVTGRDIDLSVRRSSYIISTAINLALSPALTVDDIRMLMNYK